MALGTITPILMMSSLSFDRKEKDKKKSESKEKKEKKVSFDDYMEDTYIPSEPDMVMRQLLSTYSKRAL